MVSSWLRSENKSKFIRKLKILVVVMFRFISALVSSGPQLNFSMASLMKNALVKNC